jgi:hypothetical protein
MRFFIWTICIGLLLSLAGCNKDGVCLKSTGTTVKESRAAQPFHYLEVNDNINVILTQDTTQNAISVEAGENLIAGIAAEISNGHLVLKNNNTCDWLRSYEVPVNVYVTFKELDTIVFQAAGNIGCANTWTNDSVFVNIIEGAGDLHFTVHVAKSTFQIRYGTVSVVVDGKSPVTFISSQGYGPFHAENLVSKFTYVYTFSPNDVYVYAEEELGVEIGNIGNVYYTGNPKTISKNIYGEGKLIEF